MSFEALGLSEELLRAVDDSGYTTPSPIQASAIPSVLMGRDIIGVAQTGTGKTASFVLPMIDILSQGRSRARMPRSLILEPTRELAQQVSENFVRYGKYHKLSMALLIGGVQMGDQVAALEKGVDVLIATPGRLMDLFGRGKILLTACGLLVIDEADRMLDMGFIPDIEEICTKLPRERQTLLFSATMPGPIKKLADRFMTDPKQIEVARPASTNASIAQFAVETTSRGKRATLRKLLADPEVRNAIVFCNRKRDVRELADVLKKAGLPAGQIHGDMEQADRIRELDRFKSGAIDILVASDVAARGLDVPGVSHVINYDVPHHAEDYVHRIGRTGRAGATGIAYTLLTPEDAENLREVEKLIGHAVPRHGANAADAHEVSEAAETIAVPTDALPAEAAPDEAAPDPSTASRSGDEPRKRRRRGGRGRKDKAEGRTDATAGPAVAEPRAAEPRPAEPRRADTPRPSEPRPRDDRARDARPSDRPRSRDDGPRRGDDHRSRDRRDDRRRDERDDGPDVVGFGGETPAFMLVRATA
ncbi:MAG: DEAD/DEAH box helicase [Sphingomonadaceae bacterium]|nr:DEAD/DEAH box helicase [Sphingomonadaceae bacterium]